MILDYEMKRHQIVNTVYVDDQDDIDQLLWMAHNDAHDAFVNHLCWICCHKGPYPNKTVFIFSESLTPCDRSYIHTLGRKNKMYSRTINGKINVFVI